MNSIILRIIMHTINNIKCYGRKLYYWITYSFSGCPVKRTVHVDGSLGLVKRCMDCGRIINHGDWY